MVGSNQVYAMPRGRATAAVNVKNKHLVGNATHRTDRQSTPIGIQKRASGIL